MASIVDSDAARITTPGSVGFSDASDDPTNVFSYDNFTCTPLWAGRLRANQA